MKENGPEPTVAGGAADDGFEAIAGLGRNVSYEGSGRPWWARKRPPWGRAGAARRTRRAVQMIEVSVRGMSALSAMAEFHTLGTDGALLPRIHSRAWFRHARPVAIAALTVNPGSLPWGRNTSPCGPRGIASKSAQPVYGGCTGGVRGVHARRRLFSPRFFPCRSARPCAMGAS